MAKVYRVALYNIIDGDDLIQEGLFTSAKLAKENFEAMKRTMHQDEYSKSQFGYYENDQEALVLGVVDLDKPMVDPSLTPYRRVTKYRRRNDLISLLNTTAEVVSRHADPALKSFYDQVTDHVSKDEIISVEYANKAMTYKFRLKQNDILTVKVTAKPHPYRKLDIEFS